ncbi:MAG: hypothetical protein ACREJ3_07900 [Polyangiaceae bacterium]
MEDLSKVGDTGMWLASDAKTKLVPTFLNPKRNEEDIAAARARSSVS